MQAIINALYQALVTICPEPVGYSSPKYQRSNNRAIIRINTNFLMLDFSIQRKPVGV